MPAAPSLPFLSLQSSWTSAQIFCVLRCIPSPTFSCPQPQTAQSTSSELCVHISFLPLTFPIEMVSWFFFCLFQRTLTSLKKEAILFIRLFGNVLLCCLFYLLPINFMSEGAVYILCLPLSLPYVFPCPAHNGCSILKLIYPKSLLIFTVFLLTIISQLPTKMSDMEVLRKSFLNEWMNEWKMNTISDFIYKCISQLLLHNRQTQNPSCIQQ